MILIRSDARHLPLADESVHCCVTSPPYWGLRSYHGGADMIGLEPTFDEHLANLVAVFREVRRVLRKDGTCWLNYGDAYASIGRSARKESPGVGATQAMPAVERDVVWKAGGGSNFTWMLPGGQKPKDLMMMPARVALALQADGWWLRSEIIWHKPNPMPESVTDRPTNAHEKVFLLTRSPKYFYDAEAVRVPSKRAGEVVKAKHSYEGKDSWANGVTVNSHSNLRNVWTIATQGVSAAHFATFPEKLVEPCILAGTSAEGACAKCGAPWARRMDIKSGYEGARRNDGLEKGGTSQGTGWKDGSQLEKAGAKRETLGWQPTCECEAPTVPCTVLDPFVGSGTVCRVATRFNRHAIGCDLGYQDIAANRTTNVQRMLI